MKTFGPNDVFAHHDRNLEKVPKPKRSKTGRRRRGKDGSYKTRPTDQAESVTAENEIGGSASVTEVPEGEAIVAEDSTNANNDPTDGSPRNPKEESSIALPEIRIVGLNDVNPIVAYKGHLYSCEWSTSIGSDLLFKKGPKKKQSNRDNYDDSEDDEEDDDDTEPHDLHTFGEWALLGKADAILVATPADLRPPTTGLDVMDDNVDLKAAEIPKHIRQQPLFLERLKEIMAHHGEATQHTLSALQLRTDHLGNPIVSQRKRGGRPRGNLRGSSSRGRGRPRGRRAGYTLSTPRPAATALPETSTPTPSSWSELRQPVTAGPSTGREGSVDRVSGTSGRATPAPNPSSA